MYDTVVAVKAGAKHRNSPVGSTNGGGGGGGACHIVGPVWREAGCARTHKWWHWHWRLYLPSVRMILLELDPEKMLSLL